MPEGRIAYDGQLAYDVVTGASLLGLGRTTTWELVRSGAIKSVRVGKRVLVTRAALEEFVNGLESAAS